ncbi:MAG: tetratricopeptide repeat protein [Chloroherpetonaceae bacterium]|nr:tetratricopeptide repeat protein [Chloroherpetonaceae bacterium]MDW8438519.1 tetratricopeptide repeat protein [Chloroherpetonaceae bacterium]
MSETRNLEDELQKAQTPEEKIRALTALAKALGSANPKRALDLVEQALTLIGNRENLTREKADAELTKCFALRTLSDYSSALAASQSALALYETLGDKRGVALSLMNVGNVNENLSDYHSALRCYQKSLALFEELGDKSGEAKALCNIGLCYFGFSDYANALSHYQRGLALFQERGEKHDEAKALCNIGQAFEKLSDYHSALQCYQKSLALFEELADKHGVGVVKSNIGNVYFNLSDFANAIRYYQQSLTTFREIGERRSVAILLNNVGTAYLNLADYPNALQHFQESLAIKQEIGYKKGIAYALGQIGKVYHNLADYRKALEIYQQNLALQREVGNKYGVALAMNNIGATYVQLGSHAEAEDIFQQALRLADELGLKDVRCQILRHLAELRAQMGRYEEAYRTHVAFYEARQEVFNRETQEKLSQLQVRFETEQARKQAELLQKETEIFRLRNIELAQANEKILSSIRYASRIQNALLPDGEKISRAFSEWFAFYKPQGIVSGDFYWFYEVEQTWFIAVADCTGHGVSGAFMSALGISFLNQLIAEQRLQSPAEILTRLNEMVRQALHQEKGGDMLATLQDGMDIGLAKAKGKRLTFAGARRPLYVARATREGTEIIELKGERLSVGGYGGREEKFEEHELELEKDDVAYLTTDGYADMGNAQGKSYGRKRFIALLKDIARLPMAEQKERLETEMRLFQGDAEQRDDVTIFGFKLSQRETALSEPLER